MGNDFISILVNSTISQTPAVGNAASELACLSLNISSVVMLVVKPLALFLLQLLTPSDLLTQVNCLTFIPMRRKDGDIYTA